MSLKINNKKPIEDYVNYSITEEGRIWSEKRNKWLKPRKNSNGYLIINLYKNKKYITLQLHRLVAQTYIPNPCNKPQINHKSGIKTDNRAENLEWVTCQENFDHAVLNNLMSKGENNGQSKLTWEQVNEIRKNHYSKNITKRKPWEKHGIGKTQYYNIITNKWWKN